MRVSPVSFLPAAAATFLFCLAGAGCRSAPATGPQDGPNAAAGTPDAARAPHAPGTGGGVPAAGATTPAEPKAVAIVNLDPRSGSTVSGSLAITAFPKGGVRISGVIRGLSANARHGFHIHEKGDCSAPDAKSAGAHFNPDHKPHGAQRSAANQSHAGDLGNIEADASGVAQVELQAPALTLAGGNLSLEGRAVVVHAKADDLKTQPAGDAGDRIACGVINVAQAKK